MSFIRNLNDVIPKKVNGEEIYEMVTKGDGSPIGSAIVSARESRLHHHNHTWELYLVLSENPNAWIYLDDRMHSLKQYDTVYIPPGTKHKLETNGPKNVKIHVVTHPTYSEEDYHLDE